MFKIFNRANKGFTLIELLVVIAIIGILASIVMVSMSGARAKARDAVRQSDIRQIGSAMELYYSDGEAYLTSATLPAAIGTYMTSLPSDPGSNTYGWIDNNTVLDDQNFCVFAELEDGTWFAASAKGTKADLAAVPILVTCW